MEATSEDVYAAVAEAAMGQGKEKRIGFPAGGKTRPENPLGWDLERGVPRPLEWQKTLGVIAREW